ncbi:hypothetical protein ACFLYU_02945 [Candidatus Dependentiae bacterium]
MERIIFDFDLASACISASQSEKIGQKLLPEIKKIKESLSLGYESDYASIHLLHDTSLLGRVKTVINEKKKLDISALVVIGIGGSNLGTLAIHKALHGEFYNEESNASSASKVYFVDTIDADYLGDIINLVTNLFECGENVLINVITKSGTTTETIANFEIFLSLLQEYEPENWNDYIVVTTDKGSPLQEYASKEQITCLQVPHKVGGRYSVFSQVGLFPLGFLGVDIAHLLNGAKDMLQDCIQERIDVNPAALSASIIYYHYKKGANIHDTFVFSKCLKNFGQWYRQLVGESVGKKFNKEGDAIEVGITPTVSVGTVDLHSVAQLYLAGPRDKFTTFVTAKPKEDICMPDMKEFDVFVENIQGRPLSFIMDSIVGGTKKVYKNDKRPFVSVYLPIIDEYTLGQILQWKMLEIVYLGYLLNVNPFDQPQVELYKKETRNILGKKAI